MLSLPFCNIVRRYNAKRRGMTQAKIKARLAHIAERQMKFKPYTDKASLTRHHHHVLNFVVVTTIRNSRHSWCRCVVVSKPNFRDRICRCCLFTSHDHRYFATCLGWNFCSSCGSVETERNARGCRRCSSLASKTCPCDTRAEGAAHQTKLPAHQTNVHASPFVFVDQLRSKFNRRCGSLLQMLTGSPSCIPEC